MIIPKKHALDMALQFWSLVGRQLCCPEPVMGTVFCFKYTMPVGASVSLHIGSLVGFVTNDLPIDGRPSMCAKNHRCAKV